MILLMKKFKLILLIAVFLPLFSFAKSMPLQEKIFGNGELAILEFDKNSIDKILDNNESLPFISHPTNSKMYIAYGSNLNLEQMAFRCPSAEVVGASVMRNWRLVFKGVATIERCKGSSVPVLVWHIQPSDEEALDAYEGWPRLYRKESVRVRLNGRQVRAMVYIMNGGRESPPSPFYYGTIHLGYESSGFDTNILREALIRSKKGEVYDRKD